MALPIHQDRAIGVSAAESKFIHPQHARWTWRGIGQRANQAQEAIAAAKQAQSTAEPLTRTSPDLQPDPLQSPAQRGRSTGVRRNEGRQLLGEGLPWTAWVEAAEAPDDKMEQDREPADGQIREIAGVVTVDMRRRVMALRTDGVVSTMMRYEVDQTVLAGGLTKL